MLNSRAMPIAENFSHIDCDRNILPDIPQFLSLGVADLAQLHAASVASRNPARSVLSFTLRQLPIPAQTREPRCQLAATNRAMSIRRAEAVTAELSLETANAPVYLRVGTRYAVRHEFGCLCYRDSFRLPSFVVDRSSYGKSSAKSRCECPQRVDSGGSGGQPGYRRFGWKVDFCAQRAGQDLWWNLRHLAVLPMVERRLPKSGFLRRAAGERPQ